jgi:hypothetical protein
MSNNFALQFAGILVAWSACAAAQGTAPAPLGGPAAQIATPSLWDDTSEEEFGRLKEQWLRVCLGHWQRDTHMSREEWRASCKRVVTERASMLRETQNLRRTQ